MEITSLYNRQDLIKLNKIDHLVIIGCGGIGSNLAVKAAMIGIKKFTLIDYDKVEYHNLARTPFTIEDVGSLKTDATKRIIDLYRAMKFETLYLQELNAEVKEVNKDPFKVKDLVLKVDKLRNEFETLNSYPVVDIINPTSSDDLYKYITLREDIKENSNNYLVVDTTDNYLSEEHINLETNSITLLSDYKLNYDASLMSILSNPYDKNKDGEYKIPLAPMRAASGYSVIPSFFLTPDLLTTAFMFYLVKRKEGIKHKDTMMVNVEFEDFLSQMFSMDNVLKF